MGLASVAAAVVLALLALLLQLTAAAPPPALGLHDYCNTTCGNVSVPYPFGITPGCHLPGFKLTCNTSGRGPPRLLLGDGTLRVAEISLRNFSVRVMHRGAFVGPNYSMGTASGSDLNFSFSSIIAGGPPYRIWGNNELVVYGCNVMATVGNNDSIFGGCASLCSEKKDPIFYSGFYSGCSGMGCCHVDARPFDNGSMPIQLQLRWLNRNQDKQVPVYLFVAEQGWSSTGDVPLLLRTYVEALENIDVPLILRWEITRTEQDPAPPLPGLKEFRGRCSKDAARTICKSEHSNCYPVKLGYVCLCKDGYDGNPYLVGGCRDINECERPEADIPCFGECTNTEGSFLCRCPRGRHGNYTLPEGCVKSITGLGIGIGAAGVASSLLLGLITFFMVQRFKRQRETRMKQKYFEQNRGQLLQQLVSQRADIAEKMIISVDELAKATNNFDKARELGGGGHGIVYKGILSDLHVVAIKKSKISVQKEINEFINEVAILSQINHRNVVKLFGCCLETEVPLLVYEFISNGTLYHHLHVQEQKSLSWGNRLRIAMETAGALAYLHSSVAIPVIHRDIKSTNILLDDTLTSKVSDFGASRYIPMDRTGLTTRVQGTIGYLDPVYFYTGRLTDKSDVYSFGVILVELLTRQKPYSYLSSNGDGLVTHFVDLLADGNLVEILDPQVQEEGGTEVDEVAELAATCIKLSGNIGDCSTLMNCRSTKQPQSIEEASRMYSLEQDLLMSASYPR
ncbi:unnamed protein product [Urochloa humidicola]